MARHIIAAFIIPAVASAFESDAKPAVLPSVFCFLKTFTTGYEIAIVQYMYDRRIGLFECDDFTVFTDVKFRLGPDFETEPVGSLEAPMARYGSHADTEVHLKVLRRIHDMGVWTKHAWTVKVDPDTVFFPDRLRPYLQSLPRNASLYIQNSKFHPYIHGPTEVFSRAAMQDFFAGLESCHKEFAIEHSGEDGFMHACMEMLLVDHAKHPQLLHHMADVAHCGKEPMVSFHAFKNVETWSQCYNAATASHHIYGVLSVSLCLLCICVGVLSRFSSVQVLHGAPRVPAILPEYIADMSPSKENHKRLSLWLRTRLRWYMPLLKKLGVLACGCMFFLLGYLQPFSSSTPPHTTSFYADFKKRVASFERRCTDHDIKNPIDGLWQGEDITELCNGTVIVSNFFNSKPRFQKISGWGTQQRMSKGGTPIAELDGPGRFKFIQGWYESVQRQKLCATIFHDSPGEVGEWYGREKGTSMIRFVLVDSSMYDAIYNKLFGLNDVRFFFIHQAMCANPEWEFVFYTDTFDVEVARSPIGEAQRGLVYVGKDNDLLSSTWLKEGFQDMGGAYLEFWKQQLARSGETMWSSGLVGGHRQILTEFLAKYLAALSDPNMAMMLKGMRTPRSHWGFQNVNMPALNYVCERFYAHVCKGGPPFNSDYREYQRNRTDVWFIHK